MQCESLDDLSKQELRCHMVWWAKGENSTLLEVWPWRKQIWTFGNLYTWHSGKKKRSLRFSHFYIILIFVVLVMARICRIANCMKHLWKEKQIFASLFNSVNTSAITSLQASDVAVVQNGKELIIDSATGLIKLQVLSRSQRPKTSINKNKQGIYKGIGEWNTDWLTVCLWLPLPRKWPHALLQLRIVELMSQTSTYHTNYLRHPYLATDLPDGN